MASNRLLNSHPADELTRADIRSLIEKMCALWDSIMDDPRGAQYRTDVLDIQRIVAIRAHTHHATRTARALLAVDEISGGIEKSPLIRLLLECAVTAAWLLLTPGSGHTLIRDGADQRRKALDQLASMGHSTSPGHEQAQKVIADLEDAEGPRAFIFTQRCESLADGLNLSMLYRVLSAESHAGLGIADFYSIADESSEIGLAFDPDHQDATPVATLGTAACLLLLALNANELALAAPLRTTQIRRWARKFGVSDRIIRNDGYEVPVRD